MTFNSTQGFSDLPITVPCGRCIDCRLERSRQWAIRCMHEARGYDANSFLTLTYDDAHLPSDQSLDVKHWQRFAKALRKKYGPFRFYHCGEYGDENGRLHLHAAIFGLDFLDSRKAYKKTKQGHQIYTSTDLDGVWKNGNVFIGALTFQSAAYVARYIMKKVNGPNAEGHYGGLKPEYTTMSRRPGIGKKWIEKYMSEVYPSDQVIMNGKAMRPPKFYDTQLEKHDPALFKLVKARRKKEAKKYEADNTIDRLRSKEEVTKARTRSLTRNI